MENWPLGDVGRYLQEVTRSLKLDFCAWNHSPGRVRPFLSPESFCSFSVTSSLLVWKDFSRSLGPGKFL